MAVYEPLGVMSMLCALTISLAFVIAFLRDHDFTKLRIALRGLQSLVPFLLRGVRADVDEGVGRVDPELGIALLRDEVADVGDPVSRVDGGGPAGEARGERIPLARLRLVDAQLVETGKRLLLRVAPAETGQSECHACEGENFPPEHVHSFRMLLDGHSTPDVGVVTGVDANAATW